MVTKILLICLGMFFCQEKNSSIEEVRWIYSGTEPFYFYSDTLRFTSDKNFIYRENDRTGKSNFTCIEFIKPNSVQYYDYMYDKEPPIQRFLDDGDKVFSMKSDGNDKCMLEIKAENFNCLYEVDIQKEEGYDLLLLIKK